MAKPRLPIEFASRRAAGLAAAMLLAFCALALAQTLQVSQPLQLTNGSFYERGQSIAFDGEYYWLFYGRSASIAGGRQSGDIDLNDYDIFFRRALSVAGLASVPERRLPAYDAGMTNVTSGETAAAFFNGTMYVFAVVGTAFESVGEPGRLFAWASGDGGVSWEQSEDLGADVAPQDSNFHLDAASFGGRLWLFTAGGDYYAQYAESSPLLSDSWSSLIQAGVDEGINDGSGKFFSNGTDLFVVVTAAEPESAAYTFWLNPLLQWQSVDVVTPASIAFPSVGGFGGQFIAVYSEWLVEGARAYSRLRYMSSGNLSALLGGSQVYSLTEGRNGGETWADLFARVFVDNPGVAYALFSSERNGTGLESAGHIFALPLDWNLSREHYTYISEAAGAASDGDTVNVAGGSYPEGANLTKSVFLTGVPGYSPFGPGEDAPAIAGQISIWNASNVTIRGFSFQVPVVGGQPSPSIYTSGPVSSNLNISHCSFEFNWTAAVVSPGVALDLVNISGNSAIEGSLFTARLNASAIFNDSLDNSSISFIRLDGAQAGNWTVSGNNASDSLNDSDATFVLLGDGTTGTISASSSIAFANNMVSGFGGYGVRSSLPLPAGVNASNNSFSFSASGTGISSDFSLVSAAGNWWGSNDGPIWASRSLVQGNVSFSSWCADSACASMLSVAPVPSLFVSSPSNSTLYPSSPIPLNFTAADSGSGIAECKYSLNGGANQSIDGCLNSTVNVSLSGALQGISVYAVDNAGNVNSTAVFFYAYSPASPTPTAVFPSSGPSGASGGTGDFARAATPTPLPSVVAPAAASATPSEPVFEPVANPPVAENDSGEYIFDIIVSMVETQLAPGAMPTAKISLTKFGSSKIEAVNVLYRVFDSSGKIILESQDGPEVNIHAEYLKAFALPAGTPAGDYRLYARVTYRGGLFAESEDSFSIRAASAASGLWFAGYEPLALSSIALVAAVFAFSRMKKRKPVDPLKAAQELAAARKARAAQELHLRAIAKEVKKRGRKK